MPVHLSRRFAAQIASTHLTLRYPLLLSVDDEHESPLDQPVPMSLEKTESTDDEVDQMEEVEMEDIIEEPIVDIDSGDANNPLAVVDYVDELHDYYREMEVANARH
ncbi:hypothetical protein K1719_027573 [Acacia pycnantha]|nr:hypothetical protein K1719_027573 [Acacia pycnantha]